MECFPIAVWVAPNYVEPPAVSQGYLFAQKCSVEFDGHKSWELLISKGQA